MPVHKMPDSSCPDFPGMCECVPVDLPVLIDADYLRYCARISKESGPFVDRALKHAENAERHIIHLIGLLEEFGSVTCLCVDEVDPKCPIHVYE